MSYQPLTSSKMSNTNPWVAGLAAFAVSSVVCFVAVEALNTPASSQLYTVQTTRPAVRSLTTGATSPLGARSTIMRSEAAPAPYYSEAVEELEYTTPVAMPMATETPKPLVAAAFGSLLMAVGTAMMYLRGGSKQVVSTAEDAMAVTLDWTANQRREFPSGSGFGDIQNPFMGDSVFGFLGEDMDLERGDLAVMYNRKKGQGCTKGGTQRKRVGVSGFRTRLRTVGGRKVLKARRAKGRYVLCAASQPGSKHGPGK